MGQKKAPRLKVGSEEGFLLTPGFDGWGWRQGNQLSKRFLAI